MTPVKWMHGEQKPADTMAAMFKTCKDKSWGTVPKKTAEHHLRGLVLTTLQASRVSPDAPPPGQWYNLPEYSELYAGGYANESDLFVGSTLARTLMLLVPQKQVNLFDIATLNDEPVQKWNTPQPGGDTAVPPLILVAAIVVGGSALTVGAIKLIHTAGEVIDRELSRQEDTKRVVQLHANAVPVAIEHAQREQAEGRTIPWSEGERAIFGSLRDAQVEVSKRQNRPLPGPFDGATSALEGWGNKAVDTVGNGVNNVTEGLGKGLESLLPIAAIGAAVMIGK